MSVREIAERLKFCEIDERQLKILASARPILQQCIGPALDRFYARARQTPETQKMFRDDAHMASAKAAQTQHWNKIVEGRFDEAYYTSVRKIGEVHARIGLEPKWYVGAYSLIVEEILRAVGRHSRPWKHLPGTTASQTELSAALVKAALLDMDLSISIYFEVAEKERQQAIGRLDDALARLSDGDLAVDLEGLPPSFRSLEQSYNMSLGKLRSTIGTVSSTAIGIRTGSSEIARASEDLARRTESNAANLEQTSATLIQVEERVRTTAKHALETLAIADEAIAAVDGGRDTAGGAVRAMDVVRESARGIDSVIEGLDKIAFQTRVLAMNAAVEAGRAGDAGRGFAVVADLVSSLAMRAEEEAQRARAGLTATQAEIGTAVEAVTRVDRALGDISAEVGKVHGLLGRMSNDNAAQSTAISEITATIGTMDRATQQNAAMVEQTSAAARNLTDDVERLTDQAGQFRTGQEQRVPMRMAG
jgi:methyl-accepting chemotaxis protein